MIVGVTRPTTSGVSTRADMRMAGTFARRRLTAASISRSWTFAGGGTDSRTSMRARRHLTPATPAAAATPAHHSHSIIVDAGGIRDGAAASLACAGTIAAGVETFQIVSRARVTAPSDRLGVFAATGDAASVISVAGSSGIAIGDVHTSATMNFAATHHQSHAFTAGDMRGITRQITQTTATAAAPATDARAS